MMKHKYRFTALLLFGIAVLDLLFVGFYRSGTKDPNEQKLVAVTSFYPVYIAASNIVGNCEGIELTNLSEPQTGCLHDFQLTPKDMKLLASADVFFVNGGGMESFLDDVVKQYPDLLIVETSDGLMLPGENAHVWMSIPRYRSQTETIAKTLCELAPEYEEELQSNAAAYDGELAKLCAQQEEIRQAAEGKAVISLHEAYEYLADDYGLRVIYELNLDEERQVGAGEVSEALSAIKDGGTDVIFAEETYGRTLAETIQSEAEVSVCYPDTLVSGSYDPDSYVKGMQENINLLKEVFGV